MVILKNTAILSLFINNIAKLFHDCQFCMVKEAIVPKEKHPPLTEKLTILFHSE